jgi:hypothetical protein
MGCCLLASALRSSGQATAAAPAGRDAGASLVGTIKSANRITHIIAVDRQWADILKTSQDAPKDPFVYEGSIDEKGEFHIEHLLAGRTYDLIVWTRDVRGQVTRWEGACMDYHRAILPSTAATPEDRKAIEALITDPPQFYDKVRPLRIAADHQHATALVELIRTRDFHSERGGAGGEVIYRVELWYFENLFGGWAKDNNTEKVLVRVRGNPAALQQNWQFMPELGGIEAAAFAASASTSPATQPALVINLPDQPASKHGIAGGIH